MPLETTTLPPPSELLSEEDCFAAFVPLAARIVNLRTILHYPQLITNAEAFEWVEDINSTMQDCITLLEHCRAHVKRRLDAGVEK